MLHFLAMTPTAGRQRFPRHFVTGMALLAMFVLEHLFRSQVLRRSWRPSQVVDPTSSSSWRMISGTVMWGAMASS